MEEKPIIVFLEAHLLSRDFFQSDEFIQFGTGRLLVDFFEGVKKCKQGKYIFIGDPYSLTYGKPNSCALNLDTVKEISGLSSVECHVEPLYSKVDAKGRDDIRTFLAQQIEHQLFNRLRYNYDQDTLVQLSEDSQLDHLLSKIFLENREGAKDELYKILLYNNFDCYNANKYIKEKYLKTDYTSLEEGDLLITHNNVYVRSEDSSLLGGAQLLPNGSFLRVLKVKGSEERNISIKQSSSPIPLTYIHLTVQLVNQNTSQHSSKKFDVLLLKNYLLHWDNLLKEERIALQVLLKNEFKKYLSEEMEFKKSSEYNSLIASDAFKLLKSEQKEQIKKKAERNDLGLKDLPNAKLKGYLKAYRHRLFEYFLKENPYANAIHAMYGWAITVHKAIGSTFEQVILTGEMGNNGISNEIYFRWLYSGISSGKKVHLRKAQTLHPLLDCTISVKISSPSTPSKYIQAPEQYTLSDDYNQHYSTLKNPNLAFALENFAKSLKNFGIHPTDSGKDYGKYLYKSCFSDGETEAIICFDIKGERDGSVISQIRIERANNNEMKNKINATIKQLTAQEYPIEELEDFRREIYRAWLKSFAKIGMSLHLIRALDYEDILSIRAISNNQTLASLKLYYKQSGFISSIEVRGLDPKLNTAIQEILITTG